MMARYCSKIARVRAASAGGTPLLLSCAVNSRATFRTPGSKAAAVYGQEVIYERHRHRFEVNNRYRQTLEAAGMELSGQSPDGRLVEIVELRDHPWFVASQFHPEFKSKPTHPHPLFAAFVQASYQHKTAHGFQRATESVA